MVFVENDSFRNLRRLPTDAFRSIPRLPDTLPVAASDLVAWYPFRSGTGEDITAGGTAFGDTTDYSATVNGATFQASGGTTDIQTGANSGAFDFDGTDDNLANVKGLGGTDITILTQVNISTANSAFARIYSTAENPASDGFEIQARGDDNQFRAAVRENAVKAFASTPLSSPSDGFTQVGLRYDGQTIDVIKNGGVAASTATTFNPPEIPALIGKRPDGPTASNFGGIIDSVRIYDAVLSDSQINQIFLNTKP